MQPIGLPSPMSASAPTSRISVVAPVSLLVPPVDSSVVEPEMPASSVVVPGPPLIEAGAVSITTVVVNGDVSASCS